MRADSPITESKTSPDAVVPESSLFLPPSRVDRHVAVGMAAESVCPPGSRTHGGRRT